MQPKHVAGIDEAGRGPLAGPVVCAAVILDPKKTIRGLADSKVLSELARERLFPLIQQHALAWHVVFIEADVIDQINIFQATMLGMRRALCGLPIAAEHALIDGNKIPVDLPCSADAIVGGDAREAAIMAASILAKVSRDRHMLELHARYPDYRFDRHKGYPTPAHLATLEQFGPCPEHRWSFAPVARALHLRVSA